MLGNCGTPANEMKAFRAMGIELEQDGVDKKENGGMDKDLQVPEQAVVTVGKVPFLMC